MRPRFQFHKGDQFGKWTVIDSQRVIKSPNSYFWVACQCGEVRLVLAASLYRKHSRSCGCLRRDTFRQHSQKHHDAHRRQLHPLYKVWIGIKTRCFNPHDKFYDVYGGRGITVCDEWLHDYPCFKTWALSHGYQPGLIIDRKDNDQGYSPHNCRFVTPIQSANNMSTNHLLTAFGETQTLAEWSRDPRCVVCYDALKYRVSTHHWSPEQALSTPSKAKHLKA